MPKIVVSVLGLLLVVVGFGAGYKMGLDSAPPLPPPRPRTPEQVERSIELRGELQGILMERNVLARATGLANELSELGPEGVPAVVTVLEAGGPGIGSVEASLLVRFWGLHDPVAAAEWTIKHSAPLSVRPIVAETAIETLAISNPQLARDIMEKYILSVSGLMGEVVQAGFVRGWFISGEPGLMDFIKDMGPAWPQRRHIEIVLDEMIHRDGLEATVEWLEDFPDDDVRFKRTVYRAAARELVKADLPTALAFCERHCDEKVGEHTRALLARQWAAVDGPAAMEWVSKAPAGDERDRAVWATFSDWRTYDADGLMAWVDAMGPDGVEPWFYPATELVAMWKSWESPLEAYRWAAHIPDESRRERALVTISWRHRMADEEAAEAWLVQSPLSDEARDKARNPPEEFKRRNRRPAETSG
jgi:hypothetical protein